MTQMTDPMSMRREVLIIERDWAVPLTGLLPVSLTPHYPRLWLCSMNESGCFYLDPVHLRGARIRCWRRDQMDD
jgi:hypothetical protein